MEQEEKLISYLSELFKTLNESETSRDEYIDINTLCLHGTNGFAALLSLLTGQELLPSNERKKRGIPTIASEKSYVRKKDPTRVYHEEYQNFVSAVPLHTKMNDNDGIQTVFAYAKKAITEHLHEYDIFKVKFAQLLSKRNKANLLNEIDEKIFRQLYERLARLEVIILGNGIGCADDVHSMPNEKKYEKVKIRSMIVDDSHLSFFEKLISKMGLEDVILINRTSFKKFLDQRESDFSDYQRFLIGFIIEFKDYQIKNLEIDHTVEKFFKLFGYDSMDMVLEKHGNSEIQDFIKSHRVNYLSAAELFVNHFQNKFPLDFHYSQESQPINIKKIYKKGGTPYEKEVSLIYSQLPDTPVPNAAKQAIANRFRIFSTINTSKAQTTPTNVQDESSKVNKLTK